MTIEIKHIDTFMMLRGILGVISNNISPEVYDEFTTITRKMDEAADTGSLKTDDYGYFIKEDK